MDKPTIFVVSGGSGASGKQLVETVLAQFKNAEIYVEIVPKVHDSEQLEQLLTSTMSDNMVVHTLVDSRLRSALNDMLSQHRIPSIDLVGQLMNHLTRILHEAPLGEPGRYHQLQESYFKRIAAVEFAVDHDDGARCRELPLADIVLTGVSRVGKTPLSMYLSTLGYKVANVPLIQSVTPPSELFTIDPQQVIGLTIAPGQLIHHRSMRSKRMGIPDRSEYLEPEAVYEELEFAQRLFRRGRFYSVDMTDKPIEEAAEQIISHISRQL